VATQRWLGNAAPVNQATTLTPATPSANDTFTVTCNSKSISYQTALGTVADVCSGLANAINNNVGNYAEFSEFTATNNNNTTIVLTGNTAGLPFTVSVSVTTSGSATFGQTATTAATGPNDFANGANWSTGSEPASSDDVFFDLGNVPCLYNLSQSSITLNSLNVYAAYTGTIGLPTYNAKGTYREYRTQELTISATTVNIGQQITPGVGNGSGRIKLNVGSVACTLNVFGTGQAADQGIPSLLWRGTSGSNAVNLNKGSVGLAFNPGDTATIGTLNIGYVTNQNGDVQVVCGSGCTLTTVVKQGGTAVLNAGSTTTMNYAGNLTLQAGAVTTLNCYGGSTVVNTTGTIGTINFYDNAVLDFSQDQRAKTVSNPLNVYSEAPQILDPFKVVSGLALALSGTDDLSKLSVGEKLTLTRS
jgi:hypothetical protein